MLTGLENIRPNRPPRLPLSEKQRYSRLRRSLSQRDTKVVMALGGGGIRMFAHLPVLKFLDKIGARRNIQEVWGCSGGAIVGLLYSMGVPPDLIQEEGMKFLQGRKDVRIVPSLGSVLFKILSQSVFGRKKDEQWQGFHDVQSHFQKFVAKISKNIEPRLPFYCLAYNVETSQTDILTGMDFPNGSPHMVRADPMEAVVASSAVPIVFVPKVIESQHEKHTYVDGATVEDVPTESIYRKWIGDRGMGLEKRKRLLVIAVHFTPYFSSIGYLENGFLRRVPGFSYLQLSARYADMMLQARTRVQKQMLINDPSVELWDIDIHIPGGGLLDVKRIPHVIQVAERECPKKFSEINDSLLQ